MNLWVGGGSTTFGSVLPARSDHLTGKQQHEFGVPTTVLLPCSMNFHLSWPQQPC